MAFLTTRTITLEWMDSSQISHQDLKLEAAFIRKANTLAGGRSAILAHINLWSRTWQAAGIGTPQRPVTFIDLATGSADIPLAITQWARAHHFEVRITAIDRNPAMLAIAKEHIKNDPWVTLLVADAHKLPFAKASFDYALASLFLHHLPDIEIMTVLKVMQDLATRGMIWNDLSRHTFTRWVVKLMTIRSTPVIRHDAAVSVEAGFTRNEVLAFRNRLDLHHLRYTHHWPMRFTLAGEHTHRV